MKAETRNRIRYYEKALPGIKTKVASAFFALLLAFTMGISATFAWVVLSSAPEVTAIDTTISGNGNLEIALSAPDGSEPKPSAEGDSTAVTKDATISNLTWGNLINLSDASYGISGITLRPAALNSDNLLERPLNAVQYGGDGRVSKSYGDDDFAYSYYSTEYSKFVVDTDQSKHGVRAITSVKYENLEGTTIVKELSDGASSFLNQAKTNYDNITNKKNDTSKAYIAALEGLMSAYSQTRVDQSDLNNQDVTDYVISLYEMIDDLQRNVMEPTGKGYLYLAALSAFNEEGFEEMPYESIDGLCAAAIAGTLTHSINVPSLKEFAQDYRNIKTYAETMKEKADRVREDNTYRVYWKDISSIINFMVDIPATELADSKGNFISTVANIRGKMNEAINAKNATVTGGALYRVEQRIGQRMATSATVKVDVSSLPLIGFMGKQSLTVTVKTKAASPFKFDQDKNELLSYSGDYKGSDATADDTYALAIDFWVRTNAEGSYLTLEGSVLTENVEEKATVTIGENTYDLYVAKYNENIDGYLLQNGSRYYYASFEGTIFSSSHPHATYEEKMSGGKQLVLVDSLGKKYGLYTATDTSSSVEVNEEVYEKDGAYYILDKITFTEVNTEEEFPGATFSPDDSLLCTDGVSDYTVSRVAGSVQRAQDVYENGDKYYINNTEADAAEEFVTDDSGVVYTQKMASYEKVTGYEGVNRVWEEDQMLPYLVEGGISTTQGNGSCYVFYADTPADQARFLKLLKSLKVAFINENGDLVGSAYLDSDNAWADAGRTVVPMKLLESSAVELYTNEDGKTIYGLMPLQRGAATRITAVFYLDGNYLTNENVLASGDIQGDFNIQFGSSRENVAIKDEDVMSEYVAVSASVDKTEFEYDEDNPARVKLSVDVTGTEATSVQARFSRAVSSTQGVQQEMLTLTKDGTSWSTSYAMTTPGKYVLRSVWVNGIEYALPNSVAVTVKGASAKSFALDCGSNATLLSSNSYASTGVALGLSASEQKINTVKVFFTDAEDRQTTVDLVFDQISGLWKGDAKFYNSDTYTVQYYSLNDEVYELAENLRPTVTTHVGLKAQTWVSVDEETLAKLQDNLETATAGNFVIVDPVTVKVTAKLFDSANEELGKFDNVELTYKKSGSSIGGLKSPMAWDESAGAYTGAFLVSSAGRYLFDKITVGGGTNTISSYSSAPTITALPPDNAYFFENTTEEYQFTQNKDAYFEIGIAYSGAASVSATIAKDGSNTVFNSVTGTLSPTSKKVADPNDPTKMVDVSYWRFAIPQENGSQDGNWTLNSITMAGVFYDGVFYEEGVDSKEVNLASRGIKTKAVNNINFTLVSGGAPYVLNEDQNSANGQFMQEQTVSGLQLVIEDFEKKPLENVDLKDISVVFEYSSGANTSEYGFTTESASLVQDATTTAGATLSSGSDTVYNVGDLKFKVAGEYNSIDVRYSIGDKAYTAGEAGSGSSLYFKQYVGSELQTCEKPTVKVYWTLPTVKVTATGSNKAGTKFNVNTGGRNQTAYYSAYNYISEDGFKVEVFPTHSSYNFDNSNATMELTNAGNVNSAVIDLGTVGVTTNKWEFNGNNTTAKSDLGFRDAKSMANPTGERVDIVKAIDMTYNGKTYKTDLSNSLTLKHNRTIQPSIKFAQPSGSKFTLPSEILTKTTFDPYPYTFPELSYPVSTEAPVPGDGNETVKVVLTRTSDTSWSTTTGSGCNASTTKHNGKLIEVQEQTWVNGKFAASTRTYFVKEWTLSRQQKTLNPTAATTIGTYKPGDVFDLTEGYYKADGTSALTKGYEYTATAVPDFRDEPSGEPYDKAAMSSSLNISATYYENGAEISAPSTTVTTSNKQTTFTYYNEAGEEISKPSWITGTPSWN